MGASKFDRASVIAVVHKCEDDWHIFVSPQVPGFRLVAPRNDLEEAFEAIPSMLSMLIEADFGKRVVLKSENTYQDYLESLPATYKPVEYHFYRQDQAA